MTNVAPRKPHDSPDPPTSAAFDDFGRRIPPEGLRSACHVRTRRRFVAVQPAVDYAAIHARISAQLGADGAPSAAEFEARCEALLRRLADDPATRAALAGPKVPFYLPRAAHDDVGAALEARYLPAAAASYRSALPEHRFLDHHKSELRGKLSPAPGARHDRLIAAMAGGPVVGWYLPCLLEYSIPAAIEQLKGLPEAFLLAGGYDTCAAFVGSPDLLLRRDGYPPLLWMAGLSGEREDVGYHFEAYGYNLTFNRRVHFGQAAEYWACALVVVDRP